MLIPAQLTFHTNRTRPAVLWRLEVGNFLDSENERTYSWNDWIAKDTLHRLYKQEMGGGYGNLRNLSWFCQDLNKYGATYDTREYYHRVQMKFKAPLSTLVAEWNAKRGDNVETKKLDVVEVKKNQEQKELDL